MKTAQAGVVAALLLAGCSGGGSSAEPLVVTWKFENGDCASNGVDKVRVSVTPTGGSAKTAEAACTAGRADLGTFPAGTYGVHLDGLDATGKVVASDFGVSTTLDDHGPLGTLDVTLHPKAAKVVVSWSPGCPSGFVLPYFVALYRPPPQGSTDLTDKVTELQESCASGTATLPDVKPGSYVVEVDSHAQSPRVHGTQPVTVQAGVDAQVSLQL